MCGSARAMGTGATRLQLQPGALHPEQRGVPQGSQCCTPVQAGCGVVPTALRMVGLFHLAAHPLLLAGEKILGIRGWGWGGGEGGRGWNYSFLFAPPCFSVLQTSTHRFFTVGDSPAPVFNLFAIFRARTSSTNVPAFHNLPKPQNLPKKLLQHHSSQLRARPPWSGAHGQP